MKHYKYSRKQWLKRYKHYIEIFNRKEVIDDLLATKPYTASSKGVNKFNCRYCQDKDNTCIVCHGFEMTKPTPPVGCTLDELFDGIDESTKNGTNPMDKQMSVIDLPDPTFIPTGMGKWVKQVTELLNK